MPDNEPFINNPDLTVPVPWGSHGAGEPDWAKFAADRIAEHAAAGALGSAREYVHQLEHQAGSAHLHDVSPWRILEHVAARLAPPRDAEAPRQP